MVSPPHESSNRRSTRASRPAPAASAPLAGNRKRSRADLAEPEPEGECEEHAAGPSSSKGKKKRGKRAKKEVEVQDVEESMAVDEDGPPSDGDRTSATLDADASPAQAQPLEEGVSPLDGLSAEERRTLKGKGKAVEQDDAPPLKQRGTISPGAKAEAGTAEKELAFKDSVIQTQAALLASLRSSMACTVCLETLDKPYSLSCGHISCRKCLLTWFHRADPAAAENAPPAFTDDSDGSSDSDDDIVLEPVDDIIGGSGGSQSTTDDSGSDSDSSEGAPVMRAMLGGRRVKVRATAGASDDSVWQTMERAFAAGGPALLAGGSGIGIASGSGNAGALVPSTGRRARRVDEEIEPNTGERGMAALRAMRLRRFGGGESADGAALADALSSATRRTAGTTNAASADATASTSTRARRQRSEVLPVPPPVASPSPSVSSDSSDSVILLPADPAAAIPPPAAPAHAPPTGAHRRNNLVCPQCRAAVEIAPFRIFVLSEMVALVRAAEAAGELGGPGSVEPAAAAGFSTGVPAATLPGLDESDLTWAGLFRAPGTETAQERRSRNAAVMRDHDDHVRRCFDCNWEIDEDSGLCEGCGREWDLSSDDGESLDGGGAGPAGGVFGYGGGFHFGGGGGGAILTDSERSGDEDEDEDDSEQEGFIVEDAEEDGSLSDQDSAKSSHASSCRRRRARRISSTDLIIGGSSESDEAPPRSQRRGAAAVADPPRRRGRAVVVISSDEESSSSEKEERLGEQIDVPSETSSDEEEAEGIESAHFRRRRPVIVDDEAEEGDAEESGGSGASEESVEAAQEWRRGARFTEVEDSEDGYE